MSSLEKSLFRKLAIARGMLYSAQGVLEGTLPRGDCTPEEIQQALEETKGDAERRTRRTDCARRARKWPYLSPRRGDRGLSRGGPAQPVRSRHRGDSRSLRGVRFFRGDVLGAIRGHVDVLHREPMKLSLPTYATMAPLVEHRRRMVLKGQLHLEQLAVSAAGKPWEPLPKFKKETARPRI